MTNDLHLIFLQAVLDAVPIVAGSFLVAFQAQPWAWIAIAVVATAGIVLPTRKRRSRRRA
jgi:hypothetical protein